MEAEKSTRVHSVVAAILLYIRPPLLQVIGRRWNDSSTVNEDTLFFTTFRISVGASDGL